MALPSEYKQPDHQIDDQRSYNHKECGDTKGRLYVLRTARGWAYHCHNCAPNCSGFEKDTSLLTPSALLSVIKPTTNEEFVKRDFDVPRSVVTWWDDEAAAWLGKYGIRHTERADYDLCYDESSHRVVLPIFGKQAGLRGYQTRALRPYGAKYITEKNPSVDHLFFDSKYTMYGEKAYEDESEVVLVEDIISAIKVGRQLRTYALLGSDINDEYICMLKGKKVTIWLDKDKHIQARQYCNRFRQLGVDARVVVTELDPKEHTDMEIEEILR